MATADTGFEIREARAEDAGAVYGLWTEGFVGDDEGMLSQPYGPADFADTVEVATIFVAAVAGSIAGCISLFDSDHPGINRAGEAEISRLAVAEARRRSGIGCRLLEHSRRLARARGDRAIVLWSGPHQTAGHRLYESLGYVRVPERDAVTPDGRTQLVFRLALA